MTLVNHWIVIDETGRGAVGLTKQDVVNAVPGARTVAISTYPVGDLSMAMIRGAHPTIQLSLEQYGRRSQAVQEHGRW